MAQIMYNMFKKVDNEKQFQGLKGKWVEKALTGITISFAGFGTASMVIGVENKLGVLVGLSIFLSGVIISLTTCRFLSKKYGLHGIEKRNSQKVLPKKLRRRSYQLNIK